MTVMVRERLRIGRGFKQVPWLDAPPVRRPFPVFGVALVFSLAWWAAAPEVLVASARIEGGRVLVCKHLAGARVVERQYLDLGPAHRGGQQACPLVKFG